MKILVGTENKRKLQAVENAVANLNVTEQFIVAGFSADSEVSQTPLGEETVRGAVNRAKNSQIYAPEYDLHIGIESSLVCRLGEFYEEVWSAVIYEGDIFTAYSSGVKLPKSVSLKLSPDVSNHYEIMNFLRKENGISVCAEFGVDTWGNYTGNKILREVGLEESIRNALVQIFSGEKSFYKYKK